jgi:glycerate kinase
MRILAAFDSFKESMSAYEAGQAVLSACSDTIDVDITPMADGGEGTMRAINSALAGTVHEVNVTGPQFNNVTAKLSIANGLAVIESAQACGLEYIKEEDKDGLVMTTFGVGELIKYAIERGVKKIIVTLGGSATNDGGIGMLSALGAQFLDLDGQGVVPCGMGLKNIDAIDISAMKKLIEGVEFEGLCDVDNPLVGRRGATFVFGGQKGIAKEDMPKVDAWMRSYARLSAEVNGVNVQGAPGAGAAGGLGFAILSYLHGQLVNGIDEVIRLTKLEDHIKKADLIFTGEGSIDKQTLMGKTPYGVLKIAKKYDKKVVAFAGKVSDRKELLAAGFDDVLSINHEDLPLKKMLAEGRYNLEREVRSYLEAHHYV